MMEQQNTYSQPLPSISKCPACGKTPSLGYACGEYFVVGSNVGCPVCDAFSEMHSSEMMEIEAWNRRASDG